MKWWYLAVGLIGLATALYLDGQHIPGWAAAAAGLAPGTCLGVAFARWRDH
jgi:hypothetical protein